MAAFSQPYQLFRMRNVQHTNNNHIGACRMCISTLTQSIFEIIYLCVYYNNIFIDIFDGIFPLFALLNSIFIIQTEKKREIDIEITQNISFGSIEK